MIRVLLTSAALLMLAGCGQDGGTQPQAQDSPAVTQEKSPATGSASGCEAGMSLNISATDSLYDRECLAAPADKAFEVTFDNKDAFGHSFAVYDKEGGEQIFRGEIFSGPKQLVNEIPALKAGTYHYQCDVHPFVMQGVLKVA